MLHGNVSSVSLLDIVEAIEGRFEITDPLPAGTGDVRLRRETKTVVKCAQESLAQELRAVSVEALVGHGRQRRKGKKGKGLPR